jgi:hypothetical protein
MFTHRGDGVDVVDPGARHQEGRRDQPQVRVRMQALGEAAPGPVLRAPDEPHAHGVALDVATDAHHVRWTAEPCRFVVASVKRLRPASVVLLPPAPAVGSGYPAHEPADAAGPILTQHEVPVIGDDAVRDEPDRVPLQALFEYLQERPVIRWALKDGLLDDTAVDDVKERRSERRALNSRHSWASTLSNARAVGRRVGRGDGGDRDA